MARRVSPAGRRRRPLALAGLALVSGLSLAACSGSSADALGRQACTHVARSLALFAASERETDPARAARDRAAARDELRAAAQPASLAGASGGDWQALQTTLSESPRVPERYLVSALRAQCAGVG